MSTSAQCRSCTGAAASLFRRLLPDQWARLRSSAVSHVYEAGDVVFHEGTPALAVYCVRSGALKLFRRVNHCDEVVVGMRGPGDLVGLRAVLAGLPYWTSATALERVVICAIPAQSFLELVGDNIAMAFQLLRRLACESRLVENQLVERQHNRVDKRTARFLAQVAQGLTPVGFTRPGHEISMHREEMARLIGTTPETLSRTLHGLSDRGILQLDRKHIKVRNLEALLKLAE